jgi:hypothetical protein
MMFVRVILSEDDHENRRALEEGRVHRHLKKIYIGNSLRKITRKTRPQSKAVITGSEECYIAILHEQNHENLRTLHGFCVD